MQEELKNVSEANIAERIPQQISLSPQADPFLTLIERAASNPDFDITKMQALRDMRDQELSRLAKQAYALDYTLMAPKLPKVVKTKKNKQTDSMYAAIEDINLTVNPILEAHGFATMTKIKNQTKEDVTIEAILLHCGGHSESTEITFPLDRAGIAGTVNKTAVHAISSSITYGKRVAICALLNISTGDDKDGNSQTEEVSPTTTQRNAMFKFFDQFNENQKERFIKETGGVLNVLKKDYDKTLARMKKTIGDKKNEGK